MDEHSDGILAKVEIERKLLAIDMRDEIQARQATSR
jgi:hypothetical protein